jgi:hypothetical protein
MARIPESVSRHHAETRFQGTDRCGIARGSAIDTVTARSLLVTENGIARTIVGANRWLVRLVALQERLCSF